MNAEDPKTVKVFNTRPVKLPFSDVTVGQLEIPADQLEAFLDASMPSRNIHDEDAGGYPGELVLQP